MTGEDKSQAKKAEEKKGKKGEGKEKDDSNGAALTEQDIALFKRYGKGPYAEPIKKADEDIKEFNQKISTLCGIKESDTGLALPA